MGVCGCLFPPKLSAEVERAINEAFLKMDKDGSGEVDHEEALAMFTRFGKVAAKELLSQMDKNHDNKLQKSEFHDYFELVLI